MVRIDLEPGQRLRLREMGIREGALVSITQRGVFGGQVLAVGADRLALDAAVCSRIHLTSSTTTTHDVVWDKGAQRSQNPPNVVRGDRETGA